MSGAVAVVAAGVGEAIAELLTGGFARVAPLDRGDKVGGAAKQGGAAPAFVALPMVRTGVQIELAGEPALAMWLDDA
jgi:hypothetical protein